MSALFFKCKTLFLCKTFSVLLHIFAHLWCPPPFKCQKFILIFRKIHLKTLHLTFPSTLTYGDLINPAHAFVSPPIHPQLSVQGFAIFPFWLPIYITAWTSITCHPKAMITQQHHHRYHSYQKRQGYKDCLEQGWETGVFRFRLCLILLLLTLHLDVKEPC